MKVYYFGTYFVTTDKDISGYTNVFDITTEQSILIEQGANLEVINNELFINGEPK